MVAAHMMAPPASRYGVTRISPVSAWHRPWTGVFLLLLPAWCCLLDVELRSHGPHIAVLVEFQRYRVAIPRDVASEIESCLPESLIRKQDRRSFVACSL